MNTKGLRQLLYCALIGLPLLAAASTPAQGEKALTPYWAEYNVKISVLSGQLTTELRPMADGYEAVHVIEPKGLARMLKDGRIAEQSRFTARPDGVRASWYRSEDSLSSDQTRAEVTFDWETSELAGTVND